jgi:hypothetical protein
MGREGCLNQDFQDFRIFRIMGDDGLEMGGAKIGVPTPRFRRSMSVNVAQNRYMKVSVG